MSHSDPHLVNLNKGLITKQRIKLKLTIFHQFQFNFHDLHESSRLPALPCWTTQALNLLRGQVSSFRNACELNNDIWETKNPKKAVSIWTCRLESRYDWFDWLKASFVWYLNPQLECCYWKGLVFRGRGLERPLQTWPFAIIHWWKFTT